MGKSGNIPKTFVSVQYLRGIGALIVVLYHSVSQLQRFQPTLAWPEWGAVAVDIFLVISGFAMWHMLALRAMTPAEFCRNRLQRIVPFYWVVTTIVVAVMLIAPSLLSSSRFDALHVLASYFFVPWMHPTQHGQILPVLIPGWTMQYDIAFYGLVALSLFLPQRYRFAAMTLPVIAAALLPAVVSSDAPIFIFYTQPIVIELASGVLLAWLAWKGVRLRSGTALALLAVGLGIIPFLPPPTHVVPEIGAYHAMLMREVFYAGPAFAIVGGLVFYELAKGAVRPSRVLTTLGNVSFSIYLLHPLILPAVTKLWSFAGLTQNAALNPLYLALAIAASVTAAVASYRWIELPLGRVLSRKRVAAAPMRPATQQS